MTGVGHSSASTVGLHKATGRLKSHAVFHDRGGLATAALPRAILPQVSTRLRTLKLAEITVAPSGTRVVRPSFKSNQEAQRTSRLPLATCQSTSSGTPGWVHCKSRPISRPSYGKAPPHKLEVDRRLAGVRRCQWARPRRPPSPAQARRQGSPACPNFNGSITGRVVA